MRRGKAWKTRESPAIILGKYILNDSILKSFLLKYYKTSYIIIQEYAFAKAYFKNNFTYIVGLTKL